MIVKTSKLNYYYHLDVFTVRDKYQGNQLGVVRNASNLSDEEMQAFTRETKFSEVVYILDDKEEDSGGYGVRIFTPAKELSFAGHPLIGASYIIREELLSGKANSIVINTRGEHPSTIQVDWNETNIPFVTAPTPEFGRIYSSEKERLEIAEVLGLANGIDDLADTDNLPIQWLGAAGTNFIFVPLVNLAACQYLEINREKEKEFKKTLFVFTNETINSKNHYHTRAFARAFGIDEDPATGSANSIFAGYLAKYLNKKIEARIEQGVEMGRPSLLFIEGENQEGQIVCKVGGRSVKVLEGLLSL